MHFCVIFDIYQAKLPFLDLFLALIIEKEANGRLEEKLYKGGRSWLVAHTRQSDWRKKGLKMDRKHVP